MWYEAVSNEAATATTAFIGPRRALRRRNCDRGYDSFFRAAAQAACTSTVFSHGAPFRTRVERCLPALSSLLGHKPAHETRCAELGNRDMSIPISLTITWATVSLTPGIVVNSSARS